MYQKHRSVYNNRLEVSRDCRQTRTDWTTSSQRQIGGKEEYREKSPSRTIWIDQDREERDGIFLARFVPALWRQQNWLICIIPTLSSSTVDGWLVGSFAYDFRWKGLFSGRDFPSTLTEDWTLIFRGETLRLWRKAELFLPL